MKKKMICLILCTMFSLLGLTGCRDVGELQEDFEDDGKFYTLTYYMPYNDSYTPQDMATVTKALNKLLREKINAEVNVIPYTLNEYATKVSGAIAANVPFDVCFTAPQINPYQTNVDREAFFPLDKLLPKYAPQTWASIDAELWDQARVRGKIYGVINMQCLPRTYTLEFKSKTNLADYMRETYDVAPQEFDLSTQENPDVYDFVEDYLTWLRENERGGGGNIHQFNYEATMQNYYGFDDLGTGLMVPGAVRVSDTLDDGKFEVVNQFESPEYLELVTKTKEFRERGFIDVTAKENDVTGDSNWKPGYKLGQILKLGESRYFTSFNIGSMNAVSSTSKNPARAMKFLELIGTDPEIHNLLQYGVEDVHYIKDPNKSNRIDSMIEGSGYNNGNFGWGLGTEFISYLQPGQPDNLWEEVKALNATAVKSDFTGFTFDQTKVKQKIADCRAVANEFVNAIQIGDFSDLIAKMEELKTKLKAAGADDIIREKQSQLDAWTARKLAEK